MNSRSSWGVLLILALAFLPVAGAWAYKAFARPRPFWVFYFDPEIAYFHGSRQLLMGRAPQELAHPGIPLYVLGSAILLGTGQDPTSVPAFLRVGYVLALALAAGGGLLLLRTVLRDLPPMLQVAGLWTYFICPSAMEYLTVWSPEILFFAFGALALASLWSLAAAAPGGGIFSLVLP